MDGNIKKGDWVRFYQVGRLVIGVVEYIGYDEIGRRVIHTDNSSVPIESILEVRGI